MIQRKQSIWFFLAALITALTFFLPFGINQVSTLGISTITETDLNAKSPILLTILVSATTLLVWLFYFYIKTDHCK
jgi:nucleoside recognition membrane protein YjiH